MLPNSPADVGMVVSVVDGDTIEVRTDEGEQTVRLLATNAPERGECYAADALHHLVDTLVGSEIRLEVFGTDQFDRTLAHVFAGSRHVNLDMVTLGLSLASTPADDDPYGEAILDAERSAYADRVGLWGPEACGGGGDSPELSIAGESSQPDPDGPDDDNLHDEFIVIRNNGDTVVDLGGWAIRDESSRHRFRFADGTEIAPGHELSVSSDSPGWDPGGTPVWNNDGDMALLQKEDGAVVARWRY